MAKDIFLVHFQNNLKNAIENLLHNQWNLDSFIVTTEERCSGNFNGFIDIAIKNSNNPDSILAIEIEHLSSFDQSKRNIEKTKNWVHNSQKRNCALLHIFNEDCYLSEDQIWELMRYAKINERKGLGFSYNTIFYTIQDRRMVKSIADQLVSTKNFRTTLLQLLEDAALLKSV